MDFELSEEEVALSEGIAALCSGRFPLDKVRSREGEPDVVERDGWKDLAEAGVFSLLVEEARGGLGLGMAHASVVFEELGRFLVPGPLVASALAASFLPEVMDGSVVAGSARRSGSARGFGGDGSVLVDHLGSVDVLVVVDDETSELESLSRSELEAAPVPRPLDPLTPMWRVGSLPSGVRPPPHLSAGQWVPAEEILTGALCVGIAFATLDLAVAYAKEREQFGKTIGSFQAVKHICADMLVRAESARTAVQAAAVTYDQPDVGDLVRAAAGSALVATNAALANSRSCIQVHGGMGFTWEVGLHLYLARARVLAESLRRPHVLAEVVASRY